MVEFTQDSFAMAMKTAGIKARLQKEVRFRPDAFVWAETELAFVADRSQSKGVLLLQPDEQLFMISYEISPGLVDKTGRTKPITCDFCYTWQPGGNAASITFQLKSAAIHTITFLCCGDLQCAMHVRTKTAASLVSRTQLREGMDDKQRVERLRRRLRELVRTLQLSY